MPVPGLVHFTERSVLPAHLRRGTWRTTPSRTPWGVHGRRHGCALRQTTRQAFTHGRRWRPRQLPSRSRRKRGTTGGGNAGECWNTQTFKNTLLSNQVIGQVKGEFRESLETNENKTQQKTCEKQPKLFQEERLW